MVIVAVMLAVIFVTVFQFTKADLQRQSIAMLESVAQNIQKPGAMQPQDTRLPYFTIRISIGGDVIVSGSTYYDITDEAFVEELIQRVYTEPAATGMLDEYDLRYARVSSMGGQQLIFVDISGQRAALSSLIQVSILIGVVSLIIFFVISILLARWAVKPVERAWQQQSQFVSDASHELKTPLTVIMSNAELLHSAPEDDPNRMRFAESILSMSHRMRKLVEGLLELARGDNGQINSHFAHVDFSELTKEAVMQFEPLMYEKGLLLRSEISDDIALSGNEQYLQQLVSILLDNATKYTDSGIVAVKLTRQGKGQCLLSVANPGIPLEKDDLEKIFQRFYRVDKARSEESFGLGLSIAKNITDAHKGAIWARSNETGNCFYVQLPCK